jgi:hypothetical protein
MGVSEDWMLNGLQQIANLEKGFGVLNRNSPIGYTGMFLFMYNCMKYNVKPQVFGMLKKLCG